MRCTIAEPKHYSKQPLRKQGGYALVAIVTFIMIIAAMATGGVSLTTKSERLAGNAIQRSRSFLGADGASQLAELELAKMVTNRVQGDMDGSSGIFAPKQRIHEWWRTKNIDSLAFGALHQIEEEAVLGVVEPPRYVIEEVGNYIADGDTKIVSLDIGGSDYGRDTKSGREFLLFSVQSSGKGSFESVETVVESTILITY